MTFGVFRPTVLLPAGASEWNPDRLRVVLLHELAHVRRGDVAMHLLARTALALYWWNPLAWFAWRGFLIERERATDDLVLHAGARASDYAGHLLEVARTLQPAAATAWAAIAMARRSQLEGRLVAILDSRVDRKPSGRRAPVAAAVLAIALVAPFAAMQAQDPGHSPRSRRDHPRGQFAEESRDTRPGRGRLRAGHEIRRGTATAGELARHSRTGERRRQPRLCRRIGETRRSGARRRQADEAVAFYSKAVSLRRPAGGRAGAPVPRERGRSTAGDRASAEDFFRRVLAFESKGPNANRALTWLAVLRQSIPGGESEAELLYQKALAAEPNAGNTLTNYARLLRQQNRNDEAERLEARARESVTPLDPIVPSVASIESAEE